ncbi:MAG: hypothetical protein ABI321_08795 [Polyangia bacterium]
MPKLVLQLPAAIADELRAAARDSERSVAFLVLGAMKSAAALSGEVPAARVALDVTTDDDDPKDLAARLKKLAAEKTKGCSLDEAVALAWTQRRAAILAWVGRIASVDEGQRADDLDEGLRVAADPNATPATLDALAKSPYVKVRALVAAHPAASDAALALLAADRDRVVKAALAGRSSA